MNKSGIALLIVLEENKMNSSLERWEDHLGCGHKDADINTSKTLHIFCAIVSFPCLERQELFYLEARKETSRFILLKTHVFGELSSFPSFPGKDLLLVGLYPLALASKGLTLSSVLCLVLSTQWKWDLENL